MKLQLSRTNARSTLPAHRQLRQASILRRHPHLSRGLVQVNSSEDKIEAIRGPTLGNVTVPLISTKLQKKEASFLDSSMFDLGDENASDDNTEPADCKVFIDRKGDFLPVMCCDYGFRSGSMRMYGGNDGRIPSSAFDLALTNYKKELEALRRSFKYDEYATISQLNPATNPVSAGLYGLGRLIVKGFGMLDGALENASILKKLAPIITPPELLDVETGSMTNECVEIQDRLKDLKLSNQAVWDREHAREATGGGVTTPFFVRAVYLSLCVFLDVFYEGRPIQRFWFLETVARMPYFSYIAMLHLYETLGWWRAGAELRKVHFAEEWNEMHHLSIMESLGGDQFWIDRFFAQHSAVFYYIVLCILFLFAPSLAYNFSELIEAHAVDTYGEFVDANEDLLRELPPPYAAARYYCSEDLYMFDEFQTANRDGNLRRPQCNNLYDVFTNIRDDEGQHVKTMKACQDTSVMTDLEERRVKGRSL